MGSNDSWRKEYVNKGEFYDTMTDFAKYQHGERQQGILGVLETLRSWHHYIVIDGDDEKSDRNGN